MKKIVIKLIKLYQITPMHAHSYCRYNPTCSNYMIGVIERFGLIKGLFLGIKRIIRCNPFGKFGYDPIPNKEEV